MISTKIKQLIHFLRPTTNATIRFYFFHENDCKFCSFYFSPQNNHILVPLCLWRIYNHFGEQLSSLKSYFRNHFNWNFLLTIILMSWLFTVVSLKVDDIFNYLPYPNMAVICDQGANHQFNSRWYMWDIFHILLAACNQGTTQTRQ